MNHLLGVWLVRYLSICDSKKIIRSRIFRFAPNRWKTCPHFMSVRAIKMSDRSQWTILSQDALKNVAFKYITSSLVASTRRPGKQNEKCPCSFRNFKILKKWFDFFLFLFRPSFLKFFHYPFRWKFNRTSKNYRIEINWLRKLKKKKKRN